MADQEGVRPVACGYGLLGLCCDSCLHGPCRRSPFDDAVGGKPCWGDSDWIVANNLMERVALESLQAMAAFRDTLKRVSDPATQRETAGLDAMKALLSPFSTGGNALLDLLSPEEAFPFFHSGEVPVGSWMTTLLEAIPEPPPARRNPGAILAEAFRLSAIGLAALSLPGCSALGAGNVASSTPEEIDATLPDTPNPLLLIIPDGGGLQDDSREAQETLIKRIDGACNKAARICRLPHAALLPAFARRIYAKWGLPVSMTRSIVVVFSSSAIWGLGALALGFSLVSFPGYPILGSPFVKKYLTHDLKGKFGHAYLPVAPREDPCEAIMRSLTV